MFQSKEIGPEGGTLSVHEASLEFPPGALLENMKIRLGIIWELSHQPELDGTETALCPVVYCEPQGLRFQKSVTLVMHHCATTEEMLRPEEAWEFIPMVSESKVDEPASWVEALRPVDYIFMAVQRRTVCLKLSHFNTLTTFVGQRRHQESLVPMSKAVQLVIYAFPQYAGDTFEISVACVDHYQGDVSDGVTAAAYPLKPFVCNRGHSCNIVQSP